jgi:cadmium resistance protein CadD (predicted permease)
MLAEALAAVGLIAGSFAATNLDNLALLVTWLMTNRGDRRRILLGHLGGMCALLVLALAFGIGAAVMPERYIGYLGLVPIAMGLRALYANLRSHQGGPDAPEPEGRDALTFSIATTQVANGTDTVLVIGPLLADSEIGVDIMLVIGFVAMTFAWFVLASILETQTSRLALVQRYGHWISPIVLIVVGLYILADTGTDVVAGP